MPSLSTFLRSSSKLTLLNNKCHVRRTFHSDFNRKSNKYPFTSLIIGSAISGFFFYDGLVNQFTYSGAFVRFLRSLKTVGLISFDYMLLNDNDPNYDIEIKKIHQTSADRLLVTCLKNGGLYIKVGQGFAAINHILPKEYTQTLAKLQDECLPTSRSDVDKVFLQEFGIKPSTLYEEFNYTPVAAASIAQVFKAKLKSGQEVAVKVQYNDLEQRFVSDLGTIIILHDIVEFFFKSYNFGWILRDLRKNLEQELDFMKEGKNVEKCAEDLKMLDFVYVPQVHWSHTKTRVLTMEWIDGIKIGDIVSMQKINLNIKDVDKKLFQMFSEQIFSSGFVHADPHASNIFVRKNPKNGRTQLVLLDHGLYEELPSNIRKSLCAFWEATVLKDEVGMEKAALQLGITDYMKFAEVLFQQPIRIHGGTIKTKLNEDDIQHMQELAQKNFESIMSVLKEMPRNMLFIVRNLNTVRAIGRMHGDVVNRAKVMAHYAQNSIYKDNNTFLGYIMWIYRRIYFEFSLCAFSFKRSCIHTYFNILYILGRAPLSARTIMDDMINIDAD